MKALCFTQHGDINNLLYTDLAEPKIDSNSVLVRVRACALNHLDLWVLKGWPGLSLNFPHIGGADISGEIYQIGSNVQRWKVGDRVAITPGYIPLGHRDKWTEKGEDSLSPAFQIFGESGPGGFAEYVSAPEHTLIKIPDKLSFTLAAAPLLVATTAWRMLKHRAKLQAGETVLVVGAGGGLNSFSIMLCVHFGAKVIALSSSEEKANKAKELGAEEVVNYLKNPEWSKEIKKITNSQGVDVVIDNVGEKTFSQSLKSLNRGGRLVTVGNTSGPIVTFDNRLVFAKQLSILGSTMGSAKDTREAISFAWTQPLEKIIDSEIPLSEGASAYQILTKGRQFGKLVLIP